MDCILYSSDSVADLSVVCGKFNEQSSDSQHCRGFPDRICNYIDRVEFSERCWGELENRIIPQSD